MAIEHGASLVPVINFGDWELLDNIHMPLLQNFTKGYLGFPIPFIPYVGSYRDPTFYNIFKIVKTKYARFPMYPSTHSLRYATPPCDLDTVPYSL